ncbi:MAG: 50S ribosomal protein L6 [Phototrophicaceae bacterium]|jgi:large subunit ribosomal protein L6
MSRIGKKPIPIPAKVEVKVDGQSVTVTGPKGSLTRQFVHQVSVRTENGQVVLERVNEEPKTRALHGLSRALLNNMVVGVSDGFRKTLWIEGVGYQAILEGKKLNMKLGFSHPVIIEPPEGISFTVPPEEKGRLVHISGYDKELVGQIASNLRELRPPEPYKGKGVRYLGEIIIRKAGKSGKTGKGGKGKK